MAKLGFKQRLALKKTATAPEKALMSKASGAGGADLWDLLSSVRPFINRFGTKEFMSRQRMETIIAKLLKDGVLERR